MTNTLKLGAVATCFLLSACGGEPQEEILGNWVHTMSGASLLFQEGGAGRFYNINTRWQIDGENIRIVVGNADGVGNFDLDGDKLTLKGFRFMNELNGSYRKSN